MRFEKHASMKLVKIPAFSEFVGDGNLLHAESNKKGLSVCAFMLTSFRPMYH